MRLSPISYLLYRYDKLMASRRGYSDNGVSALIILLWVVIGYILVAYTVLELFLDLPNVWDLLTPYDMRITHWAPLLFLIWYVSYKALHYYVDYEEMLVECSKESNKERKVRGWVVLVVSIAPHLVLLVLSIWMGLYGV